ncbi:MAG: sugar kinase [Acidimicrobiia bacterium]
MSSLATIDVFTLGESMLRLNAPLGTRLEATDHLEVHVAGSEANVAVALARLGRSVSWFSRLPEGPLGRKISGELARHGVDISRVRLVPETRLGIFYTEVNPSPHRVTALYDRRESAAAQMTMDDVPWDHVDRVRLVHLSGITPALSPSCRELAQELIARVGRSGQLRSIDVNYRAKLWTAAEARSCLEPMISGIDLLIVSREDAGDVFAAFGEPEEVLFTLTELSGARNVVVTLGREGAAWRSPTDQGRAPGVAATVVDRIGAGDAFAAGVIDGLLDDDLERGVRYGVAMGALALATKGDMLLASRAEIEGLVGGAGRTTDR